MMGIQLQSSVMQRFLLLILISFASSSKIFSKESCQCDQSKKQGGLKSWFAEFYHEKNPTEFQYVGNGVLVSPWIVLTSAFCVNKGMLLRTIIYLLNLLTLRGIQQLKVS